MARIIECETSERRMIKLSTNDIISVVQSYQMLVSRHSDIEDIRNNLSDAVIYLPEDV